ARVDVAVEEVVAEAEARQPAAAIAGDLHALQELVLLLAGAAEPASELPRVAAQHARHDLGGERRALYGAHPQRLDEVRVEPLEARADHALHPRREGVPADGGSDDPSSGVVARELARRPHLLEQLHDEQRQAL